jgi:hypothetical protein
VLNLKWGLAPGGGGFVLSLLVGLVTRTGFPTALLRAGIFGLVFFGIGCGLWFLISNFVPELLDTGKAEADVQNDLGETPGSRVDITLDDKKILPEMYRNLTHDGEVGNIEDLVSGVFDPADAAPQGDGGQGIDQALEFGYNEGADIAPPKDSSGGFPDLDDLAGSFMGDADEDPMPAHEEALPVRSPVGNKPQELGGDFNPKELAAGIRTVLSKDV